MKSFVPLRFGCFYVFICFFVFPCTSYKVLILPTLVKSHIFSLISIGEELASRSHFVHILLPHHFSLPGSAESTLNQSGITVLRYGSKDGNADAIDYDAMFESVFLKAMEVESGKLLDTNVLDTMLKAMNSESRRLLVGNDELFQEMLNFRYDISIVGSMFFAKYMHLIPHSLGIPWVAYSDHINPWLVRVPWLPSFSCLNFVFHAGKMTFLERLKNTLLSVSFHGFPWVSDPADELTAKYQLNGTFTSIDDLIAKSLLFITPMDPVLDDPLPSTPNIIHTGGLTIKPTKSKSLPREFEEFMQAAKLGVIIVTFGSLAPSLPKHIAEKFFEAFSQLPDFHFIWRFTNKDNLDLPKNVMIAKWLPQNDLLADPRVKLFITHCGNNGQFEATYHGVPMVGFPLLGDQEHNGKRLEHKGYGIAMNIRDFTTDGLLKSIHQVISDEHYKKRVTLASEILKSARRGPAERVGDAIEHVIRFGGDHLRPAGSDLALYQYLMLDILAFIVLAGISLMFLIWKIICLILLNSSKLFKEKEGKGKTE